MTTPENEMILKENLRRFVTSTRVWRNVEER
jgi:hypothetical protein